MKKGDELTIGGITILPGERKKVSLKVSHLYDFTGMTIPVEVVRGKKPGPKLFVCAAIHGDEINGVEIIRRLLQHRILKNLQGTLIAIPIVNVFGYNNKSRYLPDRRDLNRHFPGSPDGSLASQIAHIFMSEVVSKCTHGVDLHTGALQRTNLPQVRACLDNPETNRLAHAFKVPVMINSNLRDGSLREAARQLNIPMLLFEGGEALRHNEHVIKVGLTGLFTLMNEIGMVSYKTRSRRESKTFIALSSYWVRAPHSGSLRIFKSVGDKVQTGQLLGTISDPFGEHNFDIITPQTGIIIGNTTLPLLNRGDAAFHIATFDDPHIVEEHVEDFLDNNLKPYY